MIKSILKICIMMFFVSSVLLSCSLMSEDADNKEINDVIENEFSDSDSGVDTDSDEMAEEDDEFEDDDESEAEEQAYNDGEESDLEAELDGEVKESDEELFADEDNLEEPSGEDNELLAESDDSLEDDNEFDDELDDETDQDIAGKEQPQENQELIEEPVAESIVEETQEEIFEEPDTEVATESEISADLINITNIRFQDNESGGTVLIEGSENLQYSIRENTETNQYIIEISNAYLPEKLKRPYLMKDFPQSLFGAVNAYQDAGSNTARIVVQMKGAIKPQVQSEGSTLVVLPSGNSMAVAEESTPSETMEVVEEQNYKEQESQEFAQNNNSGSSAQNDVKGLEAKSLNDYLIGDQTFYGKPLSVQVKETDIKDVINFIADESGANIIISNSVEGKVTLKLRDIPWDQALVIIMKAHGLGYVRQGNIIRITTLAELQKENQLSQQILASQKSIEPLKVKVIPVSYAQVDQLSTQLTPFLTPTRGKLAFDKRSNSLIVTDTDQVINRVSKLIQTLDKPPLQVMIEGKIVEAKEEFSSSMGVRWNFGGGSINLGSDTTTLRPTVSSAPISLKSESVANIGFQVGQIDFIGSLSAFLSLAEKDNLVKIISAPRVVVINKEKAEMGQKGEAISISTVIEEGIRTKQVQRDPVELKLEVTPQITSAGSIIMDVNVKRQFVGPILDLETQARAINSRGAKTKVMVKNGETAVIGGVYQSDLVKAESGIPILKDIPFLGWLFRFRSKEQAKNELLIFLTPTILSQSLTR